jgi:very-short-patch-repair endonuclease
MEDFCKVTKKTFGQMYKNTVERKEVLEKSGYKIICIWENEFRKKYEKL